MNNENNYVFISYAHADSDSVMPVISEMKNRSISLWFDEGIVAGSEWPEFIARKVMDCNVFVLFVSNAYIESNNCKRELNFAISRKKNILSVFIEDVVLSPGMEMQLGTYQAVYKNRFPSEKSFIDSLCNEQFFESSKKSESANTETTPNVETVNIDLEKIFEADKKQKPKSKKVAIILSLLTGMLGIEFFYLRRPIIGVLNILLLLISILFIGLWLPALIAVIMTIVIACMKEETFQNKLVKTKNKK